MAGCLTWRLVNTAPLRTLYSCSPAAVSIRREHTLRQRWQSAALPYWQLMRLDRPIGTWLLYLPGTWSIVMATPPGALPSFSNLALFGVGAVIMRGAGCTINDMWDKDFDKKVERTAQRPLASGAISRPQALVFLGAQLSAGLAVLVNLNWYSILLGAASLPLVITYPLMKRITFWPQAFLGLTFNWGALLGYSAVAGACDWSVVLPLYGGGVAWTLVYDTLYAHQDTKDDKLVGVRSTALLLGDNTKPALHAFTAVMAGLWTLAGVNGDQLWPYFLGVASSAALSVKLTEDTILSSPASCMKGFVGHKWTGLLMLGGCAGSAMLNYM